MKNTIKEDILFYTKKKDSPKGDRKESSWYYTGLFGQVGFMVIIPILGGAFIGQYFHHTLIGIGIGLVLAIGSFIKVILDIMHTKN